MIVKMKKITLLISEQAASQALGSLRKLGLVHIKHMSTPCADYIMSLEHKLSAVDKALRLIADLTVPQKELPGENLTPEIKEIIILGTEKQKCRLRLKDLKEKSRWGKEWGNISLSDVNELEQAGIFLRLYLSDRSSFKKIPKTKAVYIINRKAGQIYLAFLATFRQDKLKLKEVEIPQQESGSLEQKISLVESQLVDIDNKLNAFAAYRDCFLKYKKELLKRLEFIKVRFGMAYQEGICCLQGFCPQPDISRINKAAKQEGWGVLVEEPDKPEEAPTLIRNPKWVEIIKPLFNFMGTLPGYKEYDISLWFLLFFSLFFAMLIGDAGYGLIFLGITFFAGSKLKTIPRQVFFLMQVLSWATIIWGAISANWFGFEGIGRLPLISNLVIPALNSFSSDNQGLLMHLCFFIGALHLTIAHGVAAVRFINSRLFLAHLGWIGIIWGIFFLAANLVLGKPFPDLAKYLLSAGIALVVLFSSSHKNIFKGIGVSLANLPLRLVNTFADTLSYLRLFAVGYASLMVAASFNQMAASIGFSNLIRSFGSAIILFLGHALNIALGIMSVLVHGVRLNMLEFSSHLDMEWSGKPYNPFKE